MTLLSPTLQSLSLQNKSREAERKKYLNVTWKSFEALKDIKEMTQTHQLLKVDQVVMEGLISLVDKSDI